MARPSKVDPCMICGELPCECNKPTIKAPVIKPPITPEAASQAREAIFAASVAAKKAMVPFVEAMKNASTALAKIPDRKISIDIDQAMFESAVRALGPLLAEKEKEKYRAILTSLPTAEEKRLVWIERRKSDGV